MSDRDELRETVHKLLDEFTEPSPTEKYLNDLENDLMAAFDQVTTRRAAEAQLEILRGFRRRDFKLDSFYEAAIIDQIAKLQPTKGSE